MTGKIQEIRTIPVLAPIPRPLRTASGFIERFPLVLIDVHTDDGAVGRAYAQIYLPELLPALESTIQGLGALVKGMPLVPRDLHHHLQKRVRLFGAKHMVGVALGGLDMAFWDAHARSLNAPLYAVLGASARPFPAYFSVGMYSAKEVGAVAADAKRLGAKGMKIKTGFPTVAEDVAAVRAAHEALGEDVALMVDYNQSLTLSQALARCHVLDDERLAWIEEPVLADDLEGSATIAAEIGTPVQIGENFHGPGEMRLALDAKAGDYVMPDPQFIQGVTGWLDAAALARVAGIEMSSHCFVEASAHLLCATPTGHWLEFMDIAGELLKERPYRIEGGCVIPSSAPGMGMEWNAAAVEKHRAK